MAEKGRFASLLLAWMHQLLLFCSLRAVLLCLLLGHGLEAFLCHVLEHAGVDLGLRLLAAVAVLKRYEGEELGLALALGVFELLEHIVEIDRAPVRDDLIHLAAGLLVGLILVACLDEFQQIADFSDAVTFQKKLRSVWQHQQNVTYCMFGSKKHLMENIFNDKSMPFYKFGDMMFLKKIDTEEWVDFICKKFNDSGKSITAKQAATICEATENLSSYVQHLSWLVWYKCDKTVTDSDISGAIDDLLEQNKVFYQREVEQLSELQVNFLRAVADGISAGFSRKDVIKKYRLISSPNIQSVKKSLQKKDLIDIDGQTVASNDSLFKLWLKRQKYYE